MCPLQCLLFSVTHFLADPCALLLLLTHVSFCPGVTSVHPASPATLPTNHTEARSSHYLNPSQLLCLPRGTTDLGRILEPGYLGSSGQWDMMRPQKGSISGDLSSGSSMYQLNSKPTGKYKAKQVNCFSKPYETLYMYTYNSLTCIPIWEEAHGACLALAVLCLKSNYSFFRVKVIGYLILNLFFVLRYSQLTML